MFFQILYLTKVAYNLNHYFYSRKQIKMLADLNRNKENYYAVELDNFETYISSDE